MNPIIDEFGTVLYYNAKQQLHREDGPAKIHYNGTKKWYFNGNLHRENGPAIEWGDGYFLLDDCIEGDWYFEGQRHRLDGPAIDWHNYKKWFIHGEQISCKNNEEFLRIVRIRVLL
jgi:hypothetical protein